MVHTSTASQLVLEEKILGRYSVEPLVAVGYEGLFGVVSVLLLFPILSIPAVAAKSTFFDLPRGWHQMMNTPTVLWSGVATACSIALFNFFGLSVTVHVSATARSLTDTCRTLAIWIISLFLGWEKLLFPVSLLQISGFSLLVYGTVAICFLTLGSLLTWFSSSSTTWSQSPRVFLGDQLRPKSMRRRLMHFCLRPLMRPHCSQPR